MTGSSITLQIANCRLQIALQIRLDGKPAISNQSAICNLQFMIAKIPNRGA